MMEVDRSRPWMIEEHERQERDQKEEERGRGEEPLGSGRGKVKTLEGRIAERHEATPKAALQSIAGSR
jgi:hypothetical protein